MKNRVLIIGHAAFSSALVRAMTGISALNRSLTRFLYARSDKDSFLMCNADLFSNIISREHDIKLIIACLDPPDIAIIRDIRIGKYGESIARIPIMVLSFYSFTRVSGSLILYHIYQSGAYLEIPFELETLRLTLDSVKSLNDEQLLSIRSDKTIFCDVIDSVAHSSTEPNYRTSLQHIISLAEANFQREFPSAKKLQSLLKCPENINGQIWPHIKNLLNKLKVEVMTDGC